jgi:hypothetical protein
MEFERDSKKAEQDFKKHGVTFKALTIPWKKTDEIRQEYKREDLGIGVRGKYFEDYSKGTNLVLLSPDVAKVFSSEKAANDPLRLNSLL